MEKRHMIKDPELISTTCEFAATLIKENWDHNGLIAFFTGQMNQNAIKLKQIWPGKKANHIPKQIEFNITKEIRILLDTFPRLQIIEITYKSKNYKISLLDMDTPFFLIGCSGICKNTFFLYTMLLSESIKNYCAYNTIETQKMILESLIKATDKQRVAGTGIDALINYFFHSIKRYEPFNSIKELAFYICNPCHSHLTYTKQAFYSDQKQSRLQKKLILKTNSPVCSDYEKSLNIKEKKRLYCFNFCNKAGLITVYMDMHNKIGLIEEEEGILFLYLKMLSLFLYPLAVSNLNRTLGQNLVTGLSMELIDPVSCSSLLVKDILKGLNKPYNTENLVNTTLEIEKELERIENRIKFYLESSLLLEKDKKWIDLKEVLNEAYHRVPQLRQNFLINDEGLKNIDPVCTYKNILTSTFIQFFINIVQHAVKGKKQEKITISIVIDEEDKGEMVQIIISDNGQSIRKNMQDKLELFLEPGYKLNPDFPGKGMGLSYARYVIEKLLGGTIKLKLTDYADNASIKKYKKNNTKKSGLKGKSDYDIKCGLTIIIDIPVRKK